MAIVKFDKTVKYNGTIYKPHVSFEVNEADVDSMIKSGAIVMQRGNPTPIVEEKKRTYTKKSDKSE